MWNKQRKDEVLIDVDDVALGHETRMRWNTRDKWIFSDDIVHDPLIDPDTFERAQDVLGARGAGRTIRDRHRTRHRYVLRGLVHCGLCGRRMQGQQSRELLFYRCRFPNEYGLANKVEHPRNVYLAERDLLTPLDAWLSRCFMPHRLADTIESLYQAQPAEHNDPAALAARRVIEEADQALARHRAALEAGADPQLVTRWMAETQARRAEALTKARRAAQPRKLTKDEIRRLTDDLGDLRQTLINADPADKAAVYRQLGLRLVYHPGKRTVRVETNLDPHSWGYGTCPRGELRTNHTARTRALSSR